MAKKTIPRTCEECNAPFLAEAYEINKGNARFCSPLCAARFFSKARRRPPNRTCKQCGALFYVSPSHQHYKHCSTACHKAAPGTLEERFWAKVDKTPGYGPQGECWPWTACADGDGYGQIGKRKAHRVSWLIKHGAIPDGLQVLHRCDNPPCVNPSHLFLGTHQDNMADMTHKGRCRNKYSVLTQATTKDGNPLSG